MGKAKNLKKRVSSYFTKKTELGPKTRLLVSEIARIETIKVESEIESLLLEANNIQKYKPKYNVRFVDSRAYPLIKITIKEKYPKVLFTRRMDDKKSKYFGPYPNVGAMRLVLKIARRIFPFQSVANHPKKLCFYHYLGLCPCPEVLNDISYRKNISHLVNFLSGKTQKVLSDLKKEQKVLVKNEEFESASENQRKIDAIKIVTSKHYEPLDYEENPNLKSDIREKELKELKEVFEKNGINLSIPRRIECYDISLISGKNATGSMVVFTNGEKDPSSYRRFRVRYEGIPNDFSMMEEVIGRRLKHNEWDIPDLIIVDGGKGQVSTALKVLKENKINIPLVGLAKREEIVVTSDLKEIRLPRDSKVLQLLQRIRDEAHRFAITYHRKLRNKSFLG